MGRGRLKTGLGKICFQTVSKAVVEQIHAKGAGYRVFAERLEKFLNEEVFCELLVLFEYIFYGVISPLL
ncbi:MAG: hypothetical protein D8H97_31380 [Neisseria sp.]|nr:MAG: hypothetical protein D8H97_31380 [Neisseria sp.]